VTRPRDQVADHHSLTDWPEGEALSHVVEWRTLGEDQGVHQMVERPGQHERHLRVMVAECLEGCGDGAAELADRLELIEDQDCGPLIGEGREDGVDVVEDSDGVTFNKSAEAEARLARIVKGERRRTRSSSGTPWRALRTRPPSEA